MAAEYLAFVDTETTGLDNRRHEVIDIWALRVRARTLEPVAEAGGKVHPRRLHAAEKRALYINGFSADIWRKEAREWREVWEEVRPVIRGAQLVGSNPSFDVGFIKAMCYRHQLPPPNIIYPLDTASMAHSLVRARVTDRKGKPLTSCSLTSLCKFFNVNVVGMEGEHTAKGDVYRTLEVYRCLTRGIQWSGAPEEMREWGA